MRIGVPTEVKVDEHRVAATPHAVHELVVDGHEVVVQAGAGEGSSLSDEEFVAAGAKIVDTAEEAWGEAELVLKVKEPLASEYGHLRDDLTLFTYLHLAADEALTRALLDAGTTGIAYETVTGPNGSLPLLAPMSEVAGRMAPQVGAASLQAEHGGRGVLLGGVPGVQPAYVVVIGAGTSGRNAAQIAAGMEARVIAMDLDIDKLRAIDADHRGRILTLMSDRLTLEEQLSQADLVIGAVLVPGARAPKVITRELLGVMKPGAVIVDIAIDQGGCAETSRVTTHSDPTYVVDGVVHYCVGNMPGAVPHTSTYGLTNVTLPHARRLARGVRQALADDPDLRNGLNTHAGVLTNGPVGSAHDLDAVPPDDALGT
ncbi:alanine dehydrogenase [Salsipaludibacter albus]|uniref:alanine dehydrogenase n=1 Tax=Salsipaludibacter albus TaxID=2849650 RepID=UPI001EE40962|nr:alanine dehydrogenase [Salsipaludibacter albus]MBY5164189.1 alanine dehydrogenase [Salsipaludibacter albus]